jgi:hypothetical protein
MADPTLIEVMDAIAARLDTVLSPLLPDLSIYARLTFNPTPPAIDIYPGDPFQEQSAFGKGSVDTWFVVRARVSTAEHEGAQDLLLSLMDPRATTSVVQAIAGANTLSGKVQHADVEPPSDFGAFVEPGSQGALLGCTWRTRVIL